MTDFGYIALGWLVCVGIYAKLTEKSYLRSLREIVRRRLEKPHLSDEECDKVINRVKKRYGL